ncbi:Uncharacterised protein [Escherichia coli]|nr:Uncharacterised protein [Escherichia coli]SRZ54090.1 Uncharacterised protein [Escherichia coli]
MPINLTSYLGLQGAKVVPAVVFSILLALTIMSLY